MKITALANWYGSNRTYAHLVGKQIGKVAHCTIPFCGGCCEIPFIETRAGVANDKHHHLINLARVVQDPKNLAEMFEILEKKLYHPVELKDAQELCESSVRPAGLFADSTPPPSSVERAAAYFVCNWMARGGSAGKTGEFSQSLSHRFSPNGGSSAKRWRSAIESLQAWSEAIKQWEFTCYDAFEVIHKVKDDPTCAIYCDPPWPEAGDCYSFGFESHNQLEYYLRRFASTRIVVRYGDHPIVREIYDPKHWGCTEVGNVNQHGNAYTELLFRRNID